MALISLYLLIGFHFWKRFLLCDLVTAAEVARPENLAGGLVGRGQMFCRLRGPFLKKEWPPLCSARTKKFSTWAVLIGLPRPTGYLHVLGDFCRKFRDEIDRVIWPESSWCLSGQIREEQPTLSIKNFPPEVCSKNNLLNSLTLKSFLPRPQNFCLQTRSIPSNLCFFPQSPFGDCETSYEWFSQRHPLVHMRHVRLKHLSLPGGRHQPNVEHQDHPRLRDDVMLCNLASSGPSH